MTIKRILARYLYVYGWQFRYLWFDTPLGARCRLTAAALVALFAGWQFVDGMRAVADGQPVQAIWPQIAMLVISMLISYALTPKTPDAVDQPGQAPKVEDGAGVRMVFGEVWITDPAVIGWKKIGTQTIRGKKSGFNGRPIIGYWYKQLFHFVLCRGPVDAVLEFRGGDKVAWQGELAASGDVQINKKDLWGGTGTGGEGGIEGPMEFLFGDAAQMPNSYLASALGPQQPAYRGLLAALFKGGLWGAFSPYPKTASFKVRRILHGWEREEGAWYPERAAVPITTSEAEFPFPVFSLGMRVRALIGINKPTDVTEEMAIKYGWPYESLGVPIMSWRPNESGLIFAKSGEDDRQVALSFISQGWLLHQTALIKYNSGDLRLSVLTPGADSTAPWAPDGAPWSKQASPMTTSLGVVNMWSAAALIPVTVSFYAMNPAHMLYQSITDSWMGAEPEAQINDASFRAAADVLYAEDFGLCTQWISSDESVESFQQRICDVIGANLSRSPIDGKWYLDLIRGGYDTSSLPVLTDDDILDYTEQPGTLVDTVNQVIVEWRDPQQREDRSTAPVQSLGSIQAAGAVIGEVATYREIPDESLALRVAGRNLQAKARPLRRLSNKVTRVAYAWRPGQVINLQSAKRGIASMYCRVGDIDRGTLRSGAISLTLLQDVFGLPQTVYVQPEPGADTGDDDVPKPVEATAVQELPYALLAALQPTGELAALPEDSGYLFAVATPAGAEIDYSLRVDAGAGYVEQAESDWSATATNVTAVGLTERSISIADARDFDRVAIGAMVLWGDEICRLDAVDLIVGTVTLGRGCADTVPAAHAAGERMWVVDDSIALDATRYSDGTTVSAKLLPRTASQRLDAAAAAALAVEFSSRAARPYPPGNFLINGAAYPATAFGEIVVTAAHRDRLLQADQLVDVTAGDIGPEPGVTYTLRYYANDVLAHTQAGITSFPAIYTPLGDCDLRIELDAERDGLPGWQQHVHSLTFTALEPTYYVDAAGNHYVDAAGNYYTRG